MIVVAGGTGRLGTLVVTHLTELGLDVRVLTRDRERARHLARGVEVVVGDVRDRDGVDAALRDATTVVSAVQGFAGPGRGTPDSVDRAGNANLVEGAVNAGADVVMLSVVGAGTGSPMGLFRAKYVAEQYLRASGVPWTIVRATAFIELWTEILTKAPVLGRGENPINFVSVGDVAAVVERAITDNRLRGAILEVGGAQNITFNEIAAAVRDARGVGGSTRHVPRPLLRALAVVARQARAALTMDTTDMTFAAIPARARFADLPLTDVRAALTAATLATRTRP